MDNKPVPVVLPRTLYRLCKEEPFKLTASELDCARWVVKEYVDKQYNYMPTFVEYVYKKARPTVADLVAHEVYSSDYLVFCNGKTYNCKTSSFEPWSEKHICMHRVELDAALGANETIEHYTVEIHPLRGGQQYLHKMLNHFINSIHDILNAKTGYRTRFTMHDLTAEWKKADARLKRINPQVDPNGYAEQQALTCKLKREYEHMFRSMYAMHGLEVVKRVIAKADINDEEYVRVHRDACRHYAVTSFLEAHPDVYNEIIEKLNFGNNELDDGGPVVLVKHEMSYEDKVWAIFDDLFGSRKNSYMVLKFLAMAMRNGDNGTTHSLFAWRSC
ncbi:hypothetical protein MRX96_031903 [Rhipicephalus microplus]